MSLPVKHTRNYPSPEDVRTSSSSTPTLGGPTDRHHPYGNENRRVILSEGTGTVRGSQERCKRPSGLSPYPRRGKPPE